MMESMLREPIFRNGTIGLILQKGCHCNSNIDVLLPEISCKQRDIFSRAVSGVERLIWPVWCPSIYLDVCGQL